jgi:membrane protease YdiL (CAAX protease family)
MRGYVVKRVTQFVRSVLPGDPFQLFILGGAVLLFISMQLRCFPIVGDYASGVNAYLQGNYRDPLAKAYQAWIAFSALARLPIVFAGAAGLFICFWPGTRQVRRILVLVCLPAIAGIVAICGRFLFLARNSEFSFVSVMQTGPHGQPWAIKTLWSIGPALHMSVLGIVLVLVFLSRLAFGMASLPLSLAESRDLESDEHKTWKRIQVFVWISIVGMSVLGPVAGIAVQSVYRIILIFVDYHRLPANAPLDIALATALLAGVAAWAVGERRWRELRQFTRVPEAQFGMLGLIFPIAVNLVPNIAFYLHDRIHWAAFEFGKFSPPIFSSYFRFPELYYFWYLPAAAFEEIIWRGYLQPRFVRRFGIIRGIFLLGVVWSAFHFLGDFRQTTEDYQVFSKLAMRLLSCLVSSYVLGWLTLRSGSIWPAALSHGLQNVLIFSTAHWLQDQDLILARAFVSICWAVLALCLFRFWPPATVQDVPDQPPEAGTEPAI